MGGISAMKNGRALSSADLRHLPDSGRAAAARSKYAAAVELYSTTDLTLRQIAVTCGVTAAGLTCHIGRYHRPLLYARYGLDAGGSEASALKVKPARGQSRQTQLKYRDAVAACGDIAYIEFNVSQIARQFGLNGTALAAQLRVHYPDVMPRREQLRQRLGIADNIHRGPRRTSLDEYGEALKLYRDTDMTVPEVAVRCNVSKSGFCQFLRFYHHDVIAGKASRRSAACSGEGLRRAGTLSGNGRLYGPETGTVDLYARALELYRTTSMTVREIVAETGVPAQGFRCYLRKWHGDDRLRRGRKSSYGKYSAAIASLRRNPRPVADVAADFSLNPDVFRKYLKNHEPELAAQQGMVRLSDGKQVKRSSYEKYREAVSEYASSAESLRSIARRHGIVYNSIMGYMLRSCPEERERHRKAVEAASAAR